MYLWGCGASYGVVFWWVEGCYVGLLLCGNVGWEDRVVVGLCDCGGVRLWSFDVVGLWGMGMCVCGVLGSWCVVIWDVGRFAKVNGHRRIR